MNQRFTRRLKSIYSWLSDKYALNVFGVVGGTVGYVLALLPSLIPRPGLFMGILGGICFMIGYGLGLLAQKTYYWLVDKRIPKGYDKKVTKIIGICAVIFIIGFAIVADNWQDEIRVLVGVEQSPTRGTFLILGGFILAATLFLVISRGVSKLYRIVLAYTKRWQILPKRVAMLTGWILATILVFTIIDGIFIGSLKSVADNHFRMVNERTGDRSSRPTSSLRSGSDESLVSWETLGRNGRDFVGSGPTADSISEFTGREAKEPIRAYVGAHQAETPRARADLAVRELERMGAFNRKYLIVNTTTGSGWVEPAAAAAVEYLHDGDIAQVALQYSYLPSWMALLVSREDATDSGRAIFEAVFEKVQDLPEDKRPKIIASGLSLGSYGSQGAFSSASDFAMRTDGALYFGTPGFSQPWREFTENRDKGSTQIKPVYRKGETVRFANNHQDLIDVTKDWIGPRVLYLQYPSDAIVWWTTDLIWNKPDWIDEPRGHDVSERTRWFPVITFLQVLVDQMFGNHFTGGHGHNYAPDVVYSWAAVTPVDDWSSEKLDDLQQLMNKRYSSVEPSSSNN